MYRLSRTKDAKLVRELHEKLMPGDEWVGEDHTFWIVTDSSGVPVGFASAILRPDLGYVFLSRSAVDPSVRGSGIHRRMIKARVKWAEKQKAEEVITYTSLKNYPSFINLLKEGFVFYMPDSPYVGTDVHYMKKAL